MEAEERPNKLRKLSNGSVSLERHPEALETREVSTHNFESLDQAVEPGPEDAVVIGSDNENGSPEIEAPAPGMSKSQLKKLRRQEQWEAGKAFRKAKRKQKAAEKKQRKREAREQAAESLETAGLPQTTPGSVRKSQFSLLPITFIIDCGFDDLMIDKERISLASQLTRVYSDNHHSLFQAHLAVSSFGAKLKERFETVLHNTHRNWKRVRFFDSDFVDVSDQSLAWMKGTAEEACLEGVFASKSKLSLEELIAKREVVYLSSESPTTLQELRPYSAYIVGGLVDKNRHKGICYKTACEKGIQTAKLPISDFMEMQSRYVLATNHVVEIMLRWLECGDWGEAFLKVIPKRKGGSLKPLTDLNADDHALNVSLRVVEGVEREPKDGREIDSVETR